MSADEEFSRYIERILSHEGGYVNHPNDPGGETKWGISKRQFPSVNIAGLTREQAIALYKRHYWEEVEALQLPKVLRFQVLDSSINHGLGNAISFLQRAVGVADDGDYGPVTKQAIARLPPVMVAVRFNAERLKFYTKLSGWPSFGKGWSLRIATNLDYIFEDSKWN